MLCNTLILSLFNYSDIVYGPELSQRNFASYYTLYTYNLYCTCVTFSISNSHVLTFMLFFYLCLFSFDVMFIIFCIFLVVSLKTSNLITETRRCTFCAIKYYYYYYYMVTK